MTNIQLGPVLPRDTTRRSKWYNPRSKTALIAAAKRRTMWLRIKMVGFGFGMGILCILFLYSTTGCSTDRRIYNSTTTNNYGDSTTVMPPYIHGSDHGNKDHDKKDHDKKDKKDKKDHDKKDHDDDHDSDSTYVGGNGGTKGQVN